MSEGPRANNGAVLLAIFSWATGLLTGVAASGIYLRTRPQAEPSPSPPGFVVSAAARMPTPWPSPVSSTPDCPSYAIWKSCDPFPTGYDGIQKAIESGATGALDLLIQTRGTWIVKIDGATAGNFGMGAVVPTEPQRRLPIMPGLHKLELYEMQKLQRLECTFRIVKGRLVRLVMDPEGRCQAEERELLPASPPSP